MGQFLETPALVKLSEPSGLGRARWRTQSDLVYMADDKTVFIVPAGYVTDLASVPRLPLMYLFTGDTAHMSAVLHDYLCTDYYPDDMTWSRAADIFLEAMQVEGVTGWRRWMMYWAVRLFGDVRYGR